MLWTIAVVLLILWLLGMVSSYTLGGFIHILLVLADHRGAGSGHSRSEPGLTNPWISLGLASVSRITSKPCCRVDISRTEHLKRKLAISGSFAKGTTHQA